MTVSALITRNDITATASQTSFTYTFRVIEATDMAVYQNGVLLSSGYTVNGVNNTTGGTVVLDVGASVGQIVSLVLAMPLDRTTNYQNSGKFLASNVNEDFDKIYIGAIQNENEGGRSLRLKDVEPPTTGVDMTIPLKADRLGKFLSFNATTGAPEASTLSVLYDSAAWTPYNFTGDGATVAFTLGSTPNSENNTQVYIDGVYQQKNGYGVVGAVLTFSVAPPNLSTIEVMVTSALPVGSTVDQPTRADLVSYLPAGTGAVITTVQAKLRESVSVKDFGAVGDGTTDDTVAIQAAIDSMTEGGILTIPTGKYRLTDEIFIRPTGGFTIRGSGGNDFRFGAPVPSGDGTFIFQESDNKSIFVFTGGCSFTIIENLTLSSTATPGPNPSGINRYGIDIRDEIPQVLWSLTFNNIVFFNLTRGISCVDTTAGSNPQDLSVAPVGLNQCIFTYCQTAIYIDTNNADCWTTTNCFFFIPSGGDGFILKRYGMMFIHQCHGGATAISNNRFIHVNGTAPLALAKLSIDGCQTESLTNSIKIDYVGAYPDTTAIQVSNCVFELGSDVYLGNAVDYISTNNRYVTGNIYIDDVGVRLSTRDDIFVSGTADIYFTSSDYDTAFQQTDWGSSPSATYQNIVYNNGKMRSIQNILSVVNTTYTAIYTTPSEAAIYEVFAFLPNDVADFDSIATVVCDGTNLTIRNRDESAGLLFQVTGRDIEVWQNTGVTQNVGYIIGRIR